MGCECSQMPEEQGEIRNNASQVDKKEPDFFQKNIIKDASPRVNAIGSNDNQGKPLYFCMRNSNSGEIVEVTRDSSGPAGKKKIERNQSATISVGWQSVQIGD